MKKEKFDLSNDEIIDLYNVAKYSQIDKDNKHYEVSLSNNGLEETREPHIFLSEVNKSIDNGTYKGLTMSVFVEDTENQKVLLREDRRSRDFDKILPSYFQEKLKSYNQKKVFKKSKKVQELEQEQEIF